MKDSEPFFYPLWRDCGGFGPVAAAERVRRFLASPPADVFSSRVPVSERHVQAVWFDSALRPAGLETSGGESVKVVDPGTWNLEAGPDFRNAVLEIGGRRVCGDVEIHMKPSGWNAHGHSSDPEYSRVAAHVTWFPGPPPAGLPPGAVSIALGDAVAAAGRFAPESIDLSAYPYAAIPETPRPCAAVLSSDPDLAVAVLVAAGKRRISVKAARFARELGSGGQPERVLWRALLGALGYKNNSEPFAALADAVPLETLPRDREDALAVLLGAARILPDYDRTRDGEAAAFARRLAERWFADGRERVPPGMRPRSGGARPANSPVRRLAAAAALACAPGGLPRLSGDLSPRALRAFSASVAQAAAWPFFEKHLAFSSNPASGGAERQTSLLGAPRIAALAANVFVPFAIASGAAKEPPDWLPPEDISGKVRLAASRLLGRDHNAALYSSNGVCLQGFLQIVRDCCMRSHPGCASCPLADALAGGPGAGAGGAQ